MLYTSAYNTMLTVNLLTRNNLVKEKIIISYLKILLILKAFVQRSRHSPEFGF